MIPLLNIDMHFFKLREKFFLNVEQDATQTPIVKYGSVFNNQFEGIMYNQTSQQCADRMLEIVPEQYRNAFRANIMKINAPYIAPHTDSDVKTVINFYVTTANAITIFYNLSNKNIEFKQIENQTDGRIFNLNDLIPIAAFRAEPGDVWILDVKQPHSVKSFSKEERIAFSLHTNIFSFDEVKEIFECPSSSVVERRLDKA